MVKRNYFVIEGPVPPELFFDRVEIIQYFNKCLRLQKYRVLIAVVAPFKFGKLSILLKLFDIATKSKYVVPILLRLNIIMDPIHTILRELSRRLNFDFVEMLEDVREGRLGLHDVFSVINEQLEKKNLYVILFIDEFQELADLVKSEGFLTNYLDRYVFEFFRGIVEAFRFGLVVSGSIIGPLLDALDVWHGRFIIFRPREFPRSNSVEMLLTLFRLSGLEVSRDLAEYIAMATNDHPYHMQLFGHYLVSIGKIDEESIEKARRHIIEVLYNYYESKIMEVQRLDPRAMDILKRVVEGLDIFSLTNDELDVAIKLERRGFIFRLNGKYEFYDAMFKRFFVNMISGRPREKYIPEYTSEYLVAKELAYKEGFRNVFASLMSWGPFDILILQKIGDKMGVGIQVKRVYGDYSPSEKILHELLEKAGAISVIPVIAVIKMPGRKIEYILVSDPSKRSHTLRHLIGLLETT